MRSAFRPILRPIALLSGVALSAGLLAAPAATAAPAPPTHGASAPTVAAPPAEEPQRPRFNFLGFATSLYDAANTILSCEDLVAQQVLCRNEPSLEDIMNKLDKIESIIQKNRERTETALTELQKSQDYQDVNTAVTNLSPIEANIEQALKAWDALSRCTQAAVRKGATCVAYNGKDKPDQSVADGMRISQRFFTRTMGAIDISIDQAVRFYAGTKVVQGRDGLLHALWKLTKNKQDFDSSTKAPGALASKRLPIITHQLASEFLPVMLYYRNLLALYGGLRPAALTFKDKLDAEAEANRADDAIFSTKDRWTVAGASAYYRIPEVPPGTIVFVGKDGKLHKILSGEGKGKPLTASVVYRVGNILAEYGYDVEKMSASGALLPDGGRWGVQEKVKHRTNPWYSNGSERYAICAGVGIAGCPVTSGVGLRKQTYEIGHPDAVGTRDSHGNLMKLRWVPIQLLNEKATWDDLVDGKLNLGGYCYDNNLKGEPPKGVWDVEFLETFLRMGVNKRAMFEWDWVRYGDGTLKCVGPGVYVSQDAGTPYSVVEDGIAPGILRD
ncbi:MAG: hypothetical protein RLZ94_2435 [Actinomycetota bacterium]